MCIRDSTDETPIVDPTSLVELRIGDENGSLIPFNAAINEAIDKITLIPDDILDSNTTYWYGILDNSIQFEETGELASDQGASFTTTSITFRWPACSPSKLPIAIEVGFLTSDGDIKEIKRLRAIL